MLSWMNLKSSTSVEKRLWMLCELQYSKYVSSDRESSSIELILLQGERNRISVAYYLIMDNTGREWVSYSFIWIEVLLLFVFPFSQLARRRLSLQSPRRASLRRQSLFPSLQNRQTVGRHRHRWQILENLDVHHSSLLEALGLSQRLGECF